MYRRMKKISQVHRHFEAIDTVFTKIGRTYTSDRCVDPSVCLFVRWLVGPSVDL